MSLYLASLFLFSTSSPPVDLVRQSLSARSDRMFLCLVIASAVTGVGVILEAPGEFHELARWWKLKRLKKAIGWKIPITFLGLVLVIGGIIGEGIFEFLSADAETAIRAHDEKVLGDTIIKAGDAKDSADAASKAAKEAAEAAARASKSSGEAINKANSVFGIAATANESATGALAMAGDAKAQVGEVQSNIAKVDDKYAPRTLSKIKREILIELLSKTRNKPKDPIHVEVAVDAPDGGSYGDELIEAINDPSTGWKASPTGELVTSDGKAKGVWMMLHDRASEPPWAAELQRALESAGIGGEGMLNPSVPAGTAAILVERKN